MRNVNEFVASDVTQCCGCGACQSVCPTGCLIMKEDSEGFPYPVIDAAHCTGCGACLHVCPMMTPPPVASEDPEACAFISDDEQARLRSSSGGCFNQLGRRILDRQGVVYGAGFDADWNVVHKRAENVAELCELMGSKYVQSRMDNVFADVRHDLEAGKTVLFSGTPCQCAGMKKYLGGNHENLILADLICHGVPSPLVWRKYLSDLAQNRTVTAVFFRFKEQIYSTPWEKYRFKVVFENNSEISETLLVNRYLRAFLSDLILRPACANCHFKGVRRASDFTLADFWGVQEVLPQAYEKNGVSLVFLHSLRAKELFSEFSGCKLVTSLENALKHNPSVKSSIIPHRFRKRFFADVQRLDKTVTELFDYYYRLDHTLLLRIKRSLIYRLGCLRRKLFG